MGDGRHRVDPILTRSLILAAVGLGLMALGRQLAAGSPGGDPPCSGQSALTRVVDNPGAVVIDVPSWGSFGGYGIKSGTTALGIARGLPGVPARQAGTADSLNVALRRGPVLIMCGGKSPPIWALSI